MGAKGLTQRGNYRGKNRRGKIKTIRVLQEILQLPLSTDSEFEGKSLEELQNLTADLQERVRQRRAT